MDPPIINEASFGAANPAAYSFAEIWPTFGMSGLRMDDVLIADSSSVTDEEQQSSYSMLLMGGGGGSGTCKKKRRDGNTLEDILNNTGKQTKISGSGDGNGGSKTEMDANLEAEFEPGEQNTRPTELPKQAYIHVRARRGQATDSHSLAERARREKISERMKILQDLVPECNKVIGKALVLDEIINYIQSLQRQVEQSIQGWVLQLMVFLLEIYGRQHLMLLEFYLVLNLLGNICKLHKLSGFICNLVTPLTDQPDLTYQISLSSGCSNISLFQLNIDVLKQLLLMVSRSSNRHALCRSFLDSYYKLQ